MKAFLVLAYGLRHFRRGSARICSDGSHFECDFRPARLVLVGVRRFGKVHAARIARLTEEGMVELVAAVDPGVVLDPPVIYGADLYADLDEALTAVGPVDVVVVAAPLGAHFRWPTPLSRPAPMSTWRSLR